MSKKARGPSGSSPYYIVATAPLADEFRRVLKHGETFAVFDHYGDIQLVGLCEQGLYHQGTRFLSCFRFSLEQERPLFLSSTIKEDNDLLVVDLTNPDLAGAAEVVVPRGSLHFFRTQFLWQGACYERLHDRIAADSNAGVDKREQEAVQGGVEVLLLGRLKGEAEVRLPRRQLLGWRHEGELGAADHAIQSTIG